MRVRLTERGDEVAAAAIESVLVADRVFLEPLTPEQRDTVAAALKQLLLPHGTD